MAKDEELNIEQETEQDSAPEMEEEKTIGISWMNPNAGYVVTPIGGHVFPDKSRQAAGME